MAQRNTLTATERAALETRLAELLGKLAHTIDHASGSAAPEGYEIKDMGVPSVWLTKDVAPPVSHRAHKAVFDARLRRLERWRDETTFALRLPEIRAQRTLDGVKRILGH